MKILITGANGMLGKAVKDEFKEENVICTDVEELDITNEKMVEEFVCKEKPNVIINCAAFTNVDKAEEFPELAYKINAIGPKNLARVAKNNNVILVHISTDYVFGGEKCVEQDYKEDDEKKPQTVYGNTKLAGEKFIEEENCKYYIFRTAWLYGEGNNFVRTMINLSQNYKEVNVVGDQYGSPTYAVDLANIIKQSLQKEIPFGVYNATNIGNTTWYDFTKKIYEFSNIDCKVNKVTSKEFVRPAKRPFNSQISKGKLLANGIMIPRYENALKRYIEKEGKKYEE